MLTQPPKKISVLALLDPEIPGGRLLDDGTWGINLAAAQLTFPDRGLKVQIPAWSSMSKGDNCKLLLDKSMVAQKTITEDIDVGERVTLFVPPLRLLTGEWELTYEVKRISQALEPGPVLKLFVKLELPGGQDTNPDYGHSELAMTFDPLDILIDGVGPQHLDKGIHVIVAPKPDRHRPYPFAAVGDVITVAWAGKSVPSDPVTQEQIDDPDAHPIRIHVGGGIIDLAGDSEGVSVSYKIRDRVYNESEDWCEAVSIVVDTESLRLGAPILEQADGLTLDLERLGDNLPRVQVWAEDPKTFQKNDDIVVLVTGTTLEEKEISVTVTQRIETTPPVRVTVSHSNSALRALAKRTAVYSYKLLRAGLEVAKSKSRAYSVIGEPTRLAAPIALDDIGGAIDPDLKQYRIRIPYDPLITPDNAIELKWLGTRPDLTTYEPKFDWFFPTKEEADAPNGFIIIVLGEYGKTLEGGTLDLSYNLLTDEGNDVISRRPSLHASRLNVGEPQRELVKPIVLGEQDGALEPADLPGGIGKVTAPRPIAVPTESGDIVTLTWIGEVSGEDGDSKTLNALSKDKDVVFTLNADFVAKNIEANRGKKVTVSYRIYRAASKTTSYSNELEFVIGEPVVLDPPTIDSVTGTVGGTEIPSGSGTTETSFKFRGKASAGLTVELRDNTTPLGTITVDANGAWEHALDEQSIGDHSYTVKGNYGEMSETEAWIIEVAEEENLLPPTLVAPATSPVDVLAYETGVMVRIEHLKALPRDKAQLVEVDPISGAKPFPLVLINQNHRANFRLDKTFLLARRGSSIKLRWMLVRGDKPIGESPELAVVINEIAENDPRLPAPNIAGVTDELLETHTLGSEAQILSAKWPLQENLQPYWIKLEGFDKSGGAITNEVRTGEPNESADGFSAQAPVDWLKQLKDGTVLRVECAVNLDGVKNRDSAIIFPTRTYNVRAVEDIKPEILSVKGMPSNGVILPDGHTIETSLTLYGSAAKGQEVEIFDRSEVKGKATADPTSGSWELAITGLSVETHAFNAIAIYGSNQSSDTWTVVIYAFNVDTSLMSLAGRAVRTGWQTSVEFIGNTGSRTPTGGFGALVYRSSSPSVASVANNGKVTGLRNGSATITVEDANKFSVSYPVHVSNVYQLHHSNQPGFTFQEAVNWKNSVPGSIPVSHALSEMIRAYGPDSSWPYPTGTVHWMCDEGGCAGNSRPIFAYRNGGIICETKLNNRYISWCLRPY